MDTKEIVLVNNFVESIPGEAAERAVNVKHNLFVTFWTEIWGKFLLYIAAFISVLFFWGGGGGGLF